MEIFRLIKIMGIPTRIDYSKCGWNMEWKVLM